jgi:hypothetical protein
LQLPRTQRSSWSISRSGRPSMLRIPKNPVAEHRPPKTDARFFVTDPHTGKSLCFARCPHCGYPARVVEDRLGKPVKCRGSNCGLVFVVNDVLPT